MQNVVGAVLSWLSGGHEADAEANAFLRESLGDFSGALLEFATAFHREVVSGTSETVVAKRRKRKRDADAHAATPIRKRLRKV